MTFLNMPSEVNTFTQPIYNIIGAVIMIVVSPFLPWTMVGIVFLSIGIFAIPFTIGVMIYYGSRGFVLLEKKNLGYFKKIGGKKHKFPAKTDQRLQMTINTKKLAAEPETMIRGIDREVLFLKVNSHLKQYHQIELEDKNSIELRIEDKTGHLYFSIKPFPFISYWQRANLLVSTLSIISLTINEPYIKNLGNNNNNLTQ